MNRRKKEAKESKMERSRETGLYTRFFLNPPLLFPVFFSRKIDFVLTWDVLFDLSILDFEREQRQEGR